MMMFRAWLVWSIWSQLSWSIMWAVFIHLVLALLTSSQVAVLVYHVGSLHSPGPAGTTHFLSGSCPSHHVGSLHSPGPGGTTHFLSGSCTILTCGQSSLTWSWHHTLPLRQQDQSTMWVVFINLVLAPHTSVFRLGTFTSLPCGQSSFTWSWHPHHSLPLRQLYQSTMWVVFIHLVLALRGYLVPYSLVILLSRGLTIQRDKQIHLQCEVTS